MQMLNSAVLPVTSDYVPCIANGFKQSWREEGPDKYVFFQVFQATEIFYLFGLG